MPTGVVGCATGNAALFSDSLGLSYFACLYAGFVDLLNTAISSSDFEDQLEVGSLLSNVINIPDIANVCIEFPVRSCSASLFSN